jgi:hypothetical protein
MKLGHEDWQGAGGEALRADLRRRFTETLDGLDSGKAACQFELRQKAPHFTSAVSSFSPASSSSADAEP